MAVGRELLPPEQADSWGEFRARLEFEAAAPGSPLIPLWSGAAGLLFGVALICCAYASTDGRWWQWVCALALLGAVGVMAVRAVDRADRRRARAAELARLNDAWLDHLERSTRPR
jgi:peptidoglycan/LPS O-acetylase OafA/YrhL